MSDVFEVLAGTWDDNEPNCKYANEFSDFDDAFAEYKRHNTRPWSALIKNGTTIQGHCPFTDVKENV